MWLGVCGIYQKWCSAHWRKEDLLAKELLHQSKQAGQNVMLCASWGPGWDRAYCHVPALPPYLTTCLFPTLDCPQLPLPILPAPLRPLCWSGSASMKLHHLLSHSELHPRKKFGDLELAEGTNIRNNRRFQSTMKLWRAFSHFDLYLNIFSRLALWLVQTLQVLVLSSDLQDGRILAKWNLNEEFFFLLQNYLWMLKEVKEGGIQANTEMKGNGIWRHSLLKSEGFQLLGWKNNTYGWF